MEELMKRRPTYAITRDDNDIRAMMGSYGFLRVPIDQKPNIVIFPGGPDISPFLYGEPRHKATFVNFNADVRDIQALRNMNDKQWKVGICRGAQFLNVMIGNGRLYQHVNNHATGYHKAFEPYVTKNPVEIEVSSTHHQMMIPGSDGVVLLASKESTERHNGFNKVETGHLEHEPEAVIYTSQNTLCYQPHPEIPGKRNEGCRQYFFDLLETYCLNMDQYKALKEMRVLYSKQH